MANATNAVQGLNQTIDLLQRILTAVESGNASSRAASPRNLSTTLRTATATGTISAVNGVGAAVSSLSPLSKIGKKTVASADDMATVIKTVSSKEVIGGVMRLGAARPFMGLFAGSMKLLVEAINVISSLRVTQKKIQSFSKAMSSLEKDVVKPLTRLLMSLPILILVCGAIGFLAKGTFKTIMIGFGVLALIGTMTVALLIGLNFAVAWASKISGKSITSKSKSGVPPVVNDMLAIMLSFTGILLLSGLVGMLGKRHFKTIMSGFWMIAKIGMIVGAILIGFNLVMGIVKMISSASLIGSLSKNKTGITVPGVKDMAIIMLSFAAMILIATGVGLLVRKNFLTITLGLQMIGLIAIGMTVVMAVLGLIGKHVGQGLKDVAHSMLMISLSLLIITGVIYAITHVAKQMNAVGKESVLDTISIVTKMLMRVALLAMGLMLLSTIVPDASIKLVIGVMAVVTVAMLAMVGCLFAIIKVAEKIADYKKANDGKDPFEVVSSIAPSIAKMILILGGSLALAYTISPLLTFHILALGKLVNVISKFVDLVSKYEADGENITPVFYNDGVITKGAKVNIIQVATNIASALGKFVSTLVTELDDVSVRDVKKMAKIGERLGKLVKPVSSFVNMVKDFSADGKNVNIHRYDKNGNIIRTDSVNMELVATNISTAFSVFAKMMDKTLDDIDIDYWAARQGERLGKLVNPISTFIDCLSKINITGEGDDLTIETMIDGKKVSTKPITTITHIGTIYSKFAKTFESIDTDKGLFGTSKFTDNVEAMAEMFENLSSVKFNDMDQIFSKNIPADVNSPWKMINSLYKVSGTNQSVIEYNTVKINAFTEAFDNLCDSLFKNEREFRNTIKNYTESVTELADRLNDVVDNLSKMNNTNISVNANGNINTETSSTGIFNRITGSSNTNTVNDSSMVNTHTSQFDMDELSERIASSLKSAINGNIRISFNDAREEIIAVLQA